MNKTLIRELLDALPASAPRILAPNERGPVLVTLYEDGAEIAFYQMSYADAERVHTELGQALARGMRRRGSSTPVAPDPGTGPLAPAMPMAVAA